MKDDASQRWDSQYDNGRDFGLMTSQALTKLLAHVDPDAEKTCLDIGCGTGQLTRELFHRGYTCTGIDYSESAIRLARSLTTQTSALTYLRADANDLESINLPQPAYGLITCKLVLAFIEDKARFLTAVRRLLAERGTLAIVTPVYNTAEQRTPISVDFSETLALLHEEFVSVEHFEGVGNVTYFICRRHDPRRAQRRLEAY